MSQHDRLLTRAADAALLTRDAAGDLTVRDHAAVPRPTTWDPTARTIEAVIATDTRVGRRDGQGEFDEVLDPATLDLASVRGVHVLNAHRQGGVGDVIGVVEDARREGNAIVARLRFSERPEIASTVTDIATGIIRSLSIGYRVDGWRDGTENGRRTRTAAKWSIHEVSFVPVAADPNARTRDLQRPANANREIRQLGIRAGASQSQIDDLIDRGATLAEATQTFMAEMINRSSPIIRSHHNDASLDNPEALRRAIGDALHARISPSSTLSPQAQQFANITLPAAAREILRAAGVSVTGLSNAEFITRALATTSDFPLLLADTMNKTLREAYSQPVSGIRQLARETTANDFRLKHRIQLDASGVALLPVGEHGEFQSGAPVDAEETYKIDTFGRIVGFSRQALVNDDLNGLGDISRRLAMNALAFEAQTLANMLVGAAGLGPVMSDTKTLFHVDHGNVASAGAALAVTPLSAARLAMRRQTGLAGSVLITVTPKFLLVPPELETVGEMVLTQLLATELANVNPFAGRLILIVEPRLLDPHRWYVVAATGEIEGLEYSYLAGSPGPQVVVQVGFRIDGVETRVRLDFGCGFVEHRGWYSNAGV